MSVVVEDLRVDNLDADRLDTLREVGIRARQPHVADLVREAAARAQVSTPWRSEDVDIEGFRAVVHLLIAFYYETHTVDARRALRRANVDYYLEQRFRPTRRTTRYLLYAAGRVLYPREYPPAATVDAPRQERTRPATENQIDALYRVAATLSDKWRPALVMIVDLIVGVGARPEELKVLRRCDIRIENHHGERWVVVTLQTPKTQPRDVPVLDADIARRIEHYVVNARHDYVMAFGSNPRVERNAINRVNDRLLERGHAERVNSKALRHRWMQEMAQLLPLEAFCRLAGLKHIPPMAELGLVDAGSGDLTAVTAYLVERDR
ncbi:tyrosine-type recombinase/integrase [Gordonia sp. NPDC003376]